MGGGVSRRSVYYREGFSLRKSRSSSTGEIPLGHHSIQSKRQG